MPKPDSINIINLASDLAQKRITVNSLPAILYVESVYGCPYSCIMCEVRESKPHLISDELLKKLEPLYPHLYMLAIHGDGEPLLGKDIDYYINVAQENNIVLHMNSTGFFLNPDLAERLLKGNKLSIRFSIHASTDATYAKIMGHDFEMVKKNIKYIVERNAVIGDKDNEFWFSYIVMKENIAEIPDFLHLASQLGIKQVRFMRLVPNRYTIRGVLRKKENFKFYYNEQFNNKIKEDFLKKLPEIKNLAKNLGISIEPGDLEPACSNMHLFDNVLVEKIWGKLSPIRHKGFCIAPWVGGCIIKQSGDVVLCCSASYSIGNLFQNNFNEIWNSSKIQSIRRKFRLGYLPKVCDSCQAVILESYPKTVFREFKDKLIQNRI